MSFKLQAIITSPVYGGTIFIPLFLYLLAGICGWKGLFIGYTLEIFFYFSWLFLLVFFAVRLVFSFQVRRRVVLNMILLLICAAGVYLAHVERPFLHFFEMRLKHEYKNTAEIQDWALSVLKTAKQDDYSIDESAYPNWASIPNFPKPFIYVVNESDLQPDGYVEIGWGGSFTSQWGLAIGKPDLPKKGNRWSGGIYFFVQ